MQDLTKTLEWSAIVEALAGIQKTPDLLVHLAQLSIIERNAFELKRRVKYDLDKANAASCCGE